MTISLGGIPLNDHLALRGLDDRQPLAQNFRHTLAGGVVVQQLQITSGQALTLAADESGGEITHGQAESVRGLQAAGAAVVLTHPRGSYTVIIRKVSWTPLVEYADVQDDDPGSGEIELIIKG